MEKILVSVKGLFTIAIAVMFSFLFSNCGGDDSEPKVEEPVIGPSASVVDLALDKQLIRGFGGATVFRPTIPLTDAEMDKLYGTGAGQIGLSILRIRVASDYPWRELELSNAKKAINREAIVIASPWSPPDSMKTNDNLIGGSLKTDSYLDYANYLADFATYMEENDAPLYGISIQNEPDIQVDYESCDWTATEMTNFLRDHGSIIQAKTKIIAPESFQFIKNFSNTIFADEVATANFDIVGAHIYGGGLSEYVLAAQKGKEVWMTEHLDTEITYPSILATGKEIHDCMTTGSYNAYIWWYLKRFYGPMDEDGTISKRGFMMAQFSKFIRPGYRRKDTKANPKSTLYVSAYQGDKAVIVVLNTGTSAVSQQFAFKNGTVTSVTPYTTSETLNLVQGTSIPVSENLTDFTYTIPAMSMVTFVED